jgi:hypothetical protein
MEEEEEEEEEEGNAKKERKRKEKKLVRVKERWWIGISAACIRRMKESRLAAMIRSCSYTLPVSSSSTRNSANCSSIATPTQAPQEKKHSSLSLSLARAQRQCSLMTTGGYELDTRQCEVKYLLKSNFIDCCSLFLIG